MRFFVSLALATSVIASNALAVTPLSPGKPAGVIPAQNLKETELYIFGAIGLVAAGFAVYLVGHNSSTSAASTSAAP
jgi:hypothetical protein